MLVQDPQGRVSLGRVLEHNFFKFAGCPPESESGSEAEDESFVGQTGSELWQLATDPDKRRVRS
jgi:hypothetical protein